MKYVIASVKIDNDYHWQVFETGTNQVVGTFYFEDEAYDLAMFYNEGGGFAGFTPSFMLQSVTPSVTDVNDEFTRIFV
jgi:hypothetical protein